MFSVSVAGDSYEQESFKDQDREWESKNTRRERDGEKKDKRFWKINDNLTVWEIQFLEASKEVLILALLSI